MGVPVTTIDGVALGDAPGACVTIAVGVPVTSAAGVDDVAAGVDDVATGVDDVAVGVVSIGVAGVGVCVAAPCAPPATLTPWKLTWLA